MKPHTAAGVSCVLMALALASRVQGVTIGQAVMTDTGIRQPQAELTLYAESLCPYCRDFTINILSSLFRNKVSHLVHIKLHAWGNVRFNESSGTWACQHGELECAYNTLFSCVTHIYPNQDTWFPYVECVEEVVKGPEGQVVENLHNKCSNMARLDADRIWKCAQGPEGRTLQLEARRATEALDPPHLGVPWVTFAGRARPGYQAVPLYDAMEYVKTLVCSSYTGNKHLPDACYEEDPPAANRAQERYMSLRPDAQPSMATAR